MTTIAIRDGVVAADRLITGGGTVLGRKTKIERVGHVIVAATGAAAVCELFIQWVRSGCTGMHPALRQQCGNDIFEATGIIVTRDRVVSFIPAGFQWTEHGLIAFGSGGDIARGAMGFGASAVQAIEIAAQFDIYTGGGVDTLHIE